MAVKFFYGNDFDDKKTSLGKDLLKIEAKYLDFFKERKPVLRKDKHDKLFNHYVMRFEGAPRFLFHKDTELPQTIREECIQAFRKHFGRYLKETVK